MCIPEDALQIHPVPLHVDPHVKESVDPVELVLPRDSLLLEHLPSDGKRESRSLEN